MFNRYVYKSMTNVINLFLKYGNMKNEVRRQRSEVRDRRLEIRD